MIFARQNNRADFIQSGVVRIFPTQKKVQVDGRDVVLQALDYELLTYLVRNAGTVLSRDQILLKVWGYDYEGNDRSVDTHIKNLRKALGEYGRYIRTVIKAGYVWEVE